MRQSSDSNGNDIGVLLEQIFSQSYAVLEAVTDMQRKVVVLPAMQQDIVELNQDMTIVKAVVRDVSRQVSDHQYLISQLEAA